MEDIGCHFKFEKFDGNFYHNTKLLLSSGRNCLRYIIKSRKITDIYLPYFLCESLTDVCLLDNINIHYYHLDENLMPTDIKKLDDNSYLYFVNYYGLLRKKIPDIINMYKYVIIDNTHDFYDKNIYNADTIYNYRKYFGIPDGACIVNTNLNNDSNLPVGKSTNKIIEMLLRDEEGKYFHYDTFKDADKYYKNEDLCYLSNFSTNYLKAIPYESILEKRISNFNIFNTELENLNELKLDKNNSINYMYPLLVKDGDSVREYLYKQGIYSQILWPNVDNNGANSEEISFAHNMLLLPIDQRYGDNEMEYIVKCIKKYYK